jgi:hypothetical protein
MSRSPPSSVTAADAALWTALDPGVQALPQPVPAGLCELPLARLSRYEPKPDPTTGRLPDEEWVHVHRLRALTGQWYAGARGRRRRARAAARGRLAGAHGRAPAVRGGGLAGQHARRREHPPPARHDGRDRGGKMVRRVRDALVRFAQVRVLVVPIAAAADPAEAFAELAAPADAAARD